MNNAKMGSLVIFVCHALLGCSASGLPADDTVEDDAYYEIPRSYLSREVLAKDNEQKSSGLDSKGEVVSAVGRQKGPVIRELAPMSWQGGEVVSSVPPNQVFPDSNELTVAADNMAVTDFLHYVFGGLLDVNYVVDPLIVGGRDASAAGVTLSLTEAISSRRLFDLTSQLLGNQGIQIKYEGNTFFIHQASATKSALQMIIGIGREKSSVPNTSQKILQVVPLKFGIKISLERTLRALTTAKITPDHEQGALFIEGSREQIMQVLDLVQMLDTPAMRGKHVGMIELNFLSPDAFGRKVSELLKHEGINLGLGGTRSNLVMVALPSIGSVAIFAADEFLLNRVYYWVDVLDVPGGGPSFQYFVYNPKFSRALDLGESISQLLTLSSDSKLDGSSAQTTGNAPSSDRVLGGDSGEVKMVVDEKANALVFYAVGSAYRSLLPLLAKLDVMPRQVLLDVTIAEVSLKDEFKNGVEWALSRGELSITTQGAFGEATVGGIGLSVVGAEGPIDASFLQSNSLVKILSNPTLMVRDGVSANISVGSSISVVGATTTDPINGERQQSTSVYRKTGVNLTVTPTVNAQGIVVMEIAQSISNTVPGSSGSGGNPDIFERQINTEVISASGQSVMLAGLISTNQSRGGSGTPGLSKIPLLGNLFKGKSESSDRTELIMIVTPHVIESVGEWAPLIKDFAKGFESIGIKNF